MRSLTPLILVTALAGSLVAGHSVRAHCGPNHVAVFGSLVSVNPVQQTFVLRRKGVKPGKANVLIYALPATKYLKSDRSAAIFDDLAGAARVDVSGTRYVDGSVGAEKVLITPAAK